MLYFFWFEIRYWLRSVMLWVFTFIVAAMVMLALSTDQVTVGGAIGNTTIRKSKKGMLRVSVSAAPHRPR